MAIEAAKLQVAVESNALKVSGEVKQLGRDVANAGKEGAPGIQGLADRFNALKSSILPAVGVLVGFGAAAKTAFDLGAAGAQIQRMEGASTQLAASMGGDMDEIVKAVRKASLYTVDDMSIMQAASRAMMLGLSSDADKLANLMEVAAFRGRAMGLSTTQAFNDIVTGVGRMSPQILDNLGIVLDAEQTFGNYAAAIGKTANELSSAEKRQALLNAVLEEGNKQIEQAGGLMEDQATQVEQLQANFANWGIELKKLAAGPVNDFSLAINKGFFGYVQIRGALAEHSEQVASTTDNYADYIQEMIRANEATGRIVRVTDDGLRVYERGSRGLIDVTEKVGFLTVTQYEEAKAAEAAAAAQEGAGAATEKAADQADNANTKWSNLAPQFREVAEASREAAEKASLMADASRELAEAQQSLNDAQANWKQNIGGDMGRLLEDAGLSQGLYKDALAATDEVLGTSLLPAQELKDAQKDLLDELKRTGDIDAYKEGLQKLTDSFMPLNEDIQEATDKVGVLQEKLNALERHYKATVEVQEVSSSSSAGIGDVERRVGRDLNGNGVIGAQHGLDMIIPPGPMGDWFNIRAASGERVKIEPAGARGETQRGRRRGDKWEIHVHGVDDPRQVAAMVLKEIKEQL